MEDPEKEVINRDTIKDVDNKFYDFFYTGGREEVRLACTCIRFYKFPCNCALDKRVCCSCG